MDKSEAGKALGVLFVVMHLLWVVAVWVGVAGAILDWTASLHFVSKQYSLNPFNLGTAILGVVLAFVAGYVIGWGFVYISERTKK